VLLAPGPLRWAIRRVLGDRSFTERARAIAAWGRENDGPARGSKLLEDYANGRGRA
jgi:UDP:flavonoid glycosyltransferase YjiC (YdhE family)